MLQLGYIASPDGKDVKCDLVDEMRELEVVTLAAEEDVVDGGAAVGRRQDVARVGVAEQVDLFLLKSRQGLLR